MRVFAGLKCTVVGEKPIIAPGCSAASDSHPQPADFLVFFFHGYQLRFFWLVGYLRFVRPLAGRDGGGGFPGYFF